VQPVRCVRLEHLKASHRADFRRQPDEVTPIEHQVFYGSQFAYRRWQRDDLPSFFRAHLNKRLEDLAAIAAASSMSASMCSQPCADVS
jgi:hypothetical protein